MRKGISWSSSVNKGFWFGSSDTGCALRFSTASTCWPSKSNGGEGQVPFALVDQVVVEGAEQAAVGL